MSLRSVSAPAPAPAPALRPARGPALLSALVLLAGCAGIPYLDAKKRTESGGELDQQKAAAQTDLDQQRGRNTDLSQARAAREAELARDARRIAALDRDLKAKDRQLAAALKAQRVDQARYNELKRQVDGLQAETDAVQKAQQQAAGAATPDAAADAAKTKQLAELEQRKKALEDALGALTKR